MDNSIFKKLIDRAEKLDWNCTVGVQDNQQYIEFYQGSPAGEDFGFTAWGNTLSEMIRSIREYADGFDEEEHVEMFIEAKNNGLFGVPSIKTLVEDAAEIQKMLNTLAWDEEISAMC